MGTAGVIAVMAGWLASMVPCVLWWGRGWFYKFFPILYGCMAGIAIAWRYRGDTWAGAAEVIIGSIGVGALFWFAIWVDAIRGSNE